MLSNKRKQLQTFFVLTVGFFIQETIKSRNYVKKYAIILSPGTKVEWHKSTFGAVDRHFPVCAYTFYIVTKLYSNKLPYTQLLARAALGNINCCVNVKRDLRV
jgi:hypothetical protein